MSREDYIEYLEEDYYRRKAIENKKLIEIQRQLANESWNLIPEENLLRSKLLSITEDSIPPMESFEVVDELDLMDERSEEESTQVYLWRNMGVSHILSQVNDMNVMQDVDRDIQELVKSAQEENGGKKNQRPKMVKDDWE